MTTVRILAGHHRPAFTDFVCSFGLDGERIFDLSLEIQDMGFGVMLVAELPGGEIAGLVKAIDRTSEHMVDHTTAVVDAFLTRPAEPVRRALCLELVEVLYDQGFTQVVHAIGTQDAPFFQAIGWDVIAPGHGYAWTDSVNHHAVRWYEPLGQEMQLAHLSFRITSLVGWDYPVGEDRGQAIRAALDQQRTRLIGGDQIGEFLVD